MPNEPDVFSIRFADEFEQSLYALSKRYRNIRVDLQPIIDKLQAGDFVGNRIAGMGEDYFILKVRVKNTNIQKGKSGGYRLIYQVKSLTKVILLTIYSKSDREDISPNEIIGILSEFYERD